MTKQELIESAILRARELNRVFLGGREVVIILSADLHRWLYGTSEAWPSLSYDGKIHDVINRNQLAGFRLGTAYPTGAEDELCEEPFARAAVFGMEYHPCMDLTDVIIVGQENNLYELCYKDPACFRDIGLRADFPEVANGFHQDPTLLMECYVAEDGHLWIKNTDDTEFHDVGACVTDMVFNDDPFAAAHTVTSSGIRTEYWLPQKESASPKELQKQKGSRCGEQAMDDFLNEFRIIQS